MKKPKTDLQALDRMTDEDIAKGVASDPDAAPLMTSLDGFKKAKVRGPQKAPTKQAVYIRLSPEVIEHFKKDGRGWQSRIDETLKKAISE